MTKLKVKLRRVSDLIRILLLAALVAISVEAQLRLTMIRLRVTTVSEHLWIPWLDYEEASPGGSFALGARSFWLRKFGRSLDKKYC